LASEERPELSVPDASPAGGDAARASGRPRAATRRVLTGSAVAVSAATLTSKLLGLIRDIVLGDRFASALTAPYLIAAQLPLTVFAAVLASIMTVFIPTFAELRAGGQQQDAERFAANVNGAATAAVGLLVLLLEIFAPAVVHAMTQSWTPSAERLTVELVRIMAPLIFFYAWSAVTGGVLNSYGLFGPNAAMGIPQNILIIASILIGSYLWGGIRLVAWGSLIGTSTMDILFDLLCAGRTYLLRHGTRKVIDEVPRPSNMTSLRPSALVPTKSSVTRLLFVSPELPCSGGLWTFRQRKSADQDIQETWEDSFCYCFICLVSCQCTLLPT